jgi:hypothetical protein
MAKDARGGGQTPDGFFRAFGPVLGQETDDSGVKPEAGEIAQDDWRSPRQRRKRRIRNRPSAEPA